MELRFAQEYNPSSEQRQKPKLTVSEMKFDIPSTTSFL